MGLLSSVFGGSVKSKSKFNQKQLVPSWIEDRSKQALDKADYLIGNTFTPYDTEKRFAPANQDMLNAFQMVRDNVGSWRPEFDQGSALFSKAGNAQWDDSARSNWMNPYTDAVIKRAQEDMQRNFQQQANMANAKRAAASGFLRPNAQADNASNRLFSDYTKESGDLTNKMMADNYDQALKAWMADRGVTMDAGRNLVMAGGERARLGQADADALLSSGATQRGLEQQKRDFDYQEYLRGDQQQRSDLALYAGLLGGVPYTREATGSSQSVTESNPSIMSAINQTLGTLKNAANTGADMYSLGSFMGGGAAGGGASGTYGSQYSNPYGGSIFSQAAPATSSAGFLQALGLGA